MPFPPSPRARSGPRRRSLLAVAPAALLVAGCSAESEKPAVAGGGSRPSAADRTRARAAQDSRELAARYDAVIAAHPKLAQRLAPLRAEVVRHAEAFGGTEPAPTHSGTAPSASSSAAPAPVVPAVPAGEKEALAELAAAERETAGRRTEALLDAPEELARLLASVAAAGAAHVYLLTEARR